MAKNLKKITRLNFQNLSVFSGQRSIFRRYCIQNVQVGIQIQVYNITNESVNCFSQFISVKVKKNLRKSQAQFREKLKKLRLSQNDGFLRKKRVLQNLYLRRSSFFHILSPLTL